MNLDTSTLVCVPTTTTNEHGALRVPNAYLIAAMHRALPDLLDVAEAALDARDVGQQPLLEESKMPEEKDDRPIKRVYKYPLRVDDETWVTMHAGATVLTVQEQNGEPFVWALVDSSSDGKLMVTRRFRLAGTGHPIAWQDNLVYRGTFQLRGGSLVFHLFEYD